jgi:alpha-L-fucosidase 2
MTVKMQGETMLRYARPARAWVEAVPLGNGQTGAMHFGGVGHDRIALNDEACWSGSPEGSRRSAAPRGEVGPAVLEAVRAAVQEGRVREAEALLRGLQGGHTQSYLPLGDLLLEVRVNGVLPTADTVTGYRRALDLDEASATSEWGVDGVAVRTEVFVSAPSGALVLRLRAGVAGVLSVRVAMTSLLSHTTRTDGRNGLALLVRCPANVSPTHADDQSPVVYTDGAEQGMAAAVAIRLTSDRIVEPADDALVVRDATEVLLVLATQSGYAGWDAPLTLTAEQCWQSADARAAGAAGRAYTDLKEEHERDHRELFRRCSLHLPTDAAVEGLPTDERLRRATAGDDDPGLAALLFNYGRYLLIASSRVGGLPATLQGIWNAELQPPWSSNYTININTEMNYWPAEVTALPECHEPLLDFVERLAESGRPVAQQLYGCGGWVAHHNADLWGWTAPVSGDPVWANWPMGGVWLCRHVWDHYAFTGDRAFLLRAWPLLRGAAEFCLAWLVEMPDGRFGTSPSTSPENTFVAADGEPASVTQSATMDIALIYDLFARCVAAAADLAIEDPLLPLLIAAWSRLPVATVGSRGQLLEWAGELPETDPHHRHVSHLVGVYPGDAITVDATPRLAVAAARSLDLRGDGGTGWSLAWKVCLRARLRDGEAAHRLVRELLTLTHEPGTEYGGAGAGVYSNLFCAHPPFQIDGNFGATAGIAEMLLQSHADELHLLPALPLAWSEGNVAGLRARGGVVVDVAWSKGRLASAELMSDEDRDVVVRLGDARATVSLAAGEPTRIGADLRGF